MCKLLKVNGIQSNYIVKEEYKGKYIFGKAYGKMYEKDIHAPGSVDCFLLDNMILLNKDTFRKFYPGNMNIKTDKKFKGFSGYISQLQGKNGEETLINIFKDLNEKVRKYDVDFKDMVFGGFELDILQRNTDWCTDISRVFLSLCQYIGIPARLIYLANLKKAYHGHVIVEVYYEESWGLFDVVQGIQYYLNQPISAYDILCDKKLIETCFKNIGKKANKNDIDQFLGIAICEYDISKVSIYDYTTSVGKSNDYYNKIIKYGNLGEWLFDEDK